MLTTTLKNYTESTLPKKWIAEIFYRNWFKMFVPKELGGLEYTLTEGLQKLIYSATQNGSLGWIHNLGSGAGYFCGSFEHNIARELFSNATAVIAGSGQVGGNAFTKGDGYILEGKWDNCSGAAHASLFTVNALCEDSQVRTFTLYPKQVTLHNHWNSFGLKATSSYALEVNSCYVPKEMTFKIEEIKSFPDYPLYQIPFNIFARFCLVATLIGITDCFLNHLINTPTLKLERIKSQVIELKILREEHEKKVTKLAQECWDMVNTNCFSQEKFGQTLQDLVAQINQSCYKKTCDIYYHTGLQLSNEKELAHWAFRDVMTATHHFLLK